MGDWKLFWKTGEKNRKNAYLNYNWLREKIANLVGVNGNLIVVEGIQFALID